MSNHKDNCREYPKYLRTMIDEIARREDETMMGSKRRKQQIETTVSSSEMGKKGPSSYVLVGRSEEAMTSASSITASGSFTLKTDATRSLGSSGKGSTVSSITNDAELHDINKEKKHQCPPKIVNMSNTPAKPTCLPYAQLCFDADRNTLVTLMEINLSSQTGRQSKRLRIVHEDGRDSAEFPKTATCLTDHPEKAVEETEDTTFSFQEGSEPSEETFDHWFEESDLLDLYLLHDSQDPWVMTDHARVGCAETLRKLLGASKSFVASRSRALSDPGAPGNCKAGSKFDTIGYSFLAEI